MRPVQSSDELLDDLLECGGCSDWLALLRSSPAQAHQLLCLQLDALKLDLARRRNQLDGDNALFAVRARAMLDEAEVRLGKIVALIEEYPSDAPAHYRWLDRAFERADKLFARALEAAQAVVVTRVAPLVAEAELAVAGEDHRDEHSPHLVPLISSPLAAHAPPGRAKCSQVRREALAA
jgi:hypothetical protein